MKLTKNDVTTIDSQIEIEKAQVQKGLKALPMLTYGERSEP